MPEHHTRSTLHAKIDETYRRINEVDRPEIWITLRSHADVSADVETLARRLEAGERLPLAGVTVAVKDNIDVAGIPTTAGSPRPVVHPSDHATCVQLLVDAGALIIGKTNMDQFATGLVGTRSPYGAVRAAFEPERVSGGSSSGSGVAVALGLTDVALGTDTAGSGRVPAAFNRIVGVKPTLGLISISGVFPARPSYDTVSVFARTLHEAESVMRVLAVPDRADRASRAWLSDAPLDAPSSLKLGVPDEQALDAMDPSWRGVWNSTIEKLVAAGWNVVPLDITFLLDAAKLLYGSTLVAERIYSFGAELDDLGDSADPSVRAVVEPGRHADATTFVADQQRIREYRRQVGLLWDEIDMLAVPTAPGQPTIAEVDADPLAKNAWVGTYTNFVNLLDLAAVAVPITANDRWAGLTLVGPAFSDVRLLRAAERLKGEHGTGGGVSTIHSDRSETRTDDPQRWLAPSVSLAVFGLHMSGLPLNHQLEKVGATLLGAVETAPQYEFYELALQPPRPGLVRVSTGGARIRGELWAFPPAGLATFLNDNLVSPMAIGKVSLSDGQEVLGFTCEKHALEGAKNITSRGRW